MTITTTDRAPKQVAINDIGSAEDFLAAVEKTLKFFNDGDLIEGTVVKIDRDEVLLDVGYKTEGVIPSRELSIKHDVDPTEVVQVGDVVEALVLQKEDKEGRLILSKKRAQYERAWGDVEKIKETDGVVTGSVIEVVKGGLIVDIGLRGFLPASLIELRRVRDLTPYLGQEIEAKILELDKNRNNVVLSRRALLEQTQSESRTTFLNNLAKGQVRKGVVSSIVNFGAFVDLGGIDGLLHVTDISYKRVQHPGEVINIGDTVKVQIVRINRETQRISLGMKQLEADPWEGAAAKYVVDGTFTGRVTNITEYGAFVELEPGIEGLVHVSEMSWTKKNVHPGKIVSTSQEVEVKVLEVDEEKRRISLGLKQAQSNPWNDFFEKNPVGTEVEGEVKNSTEFGLFIGLDGDVDGMVHMSDISWGVSGEEALALHHKGETVKAVVLDVDVEKERISLGMKQLERGGVAKPGTTGAASNKGETVTVTVLEVRDGGLDVQVGDDGATGFIKRTDLGRDRDEQRPERFQVGQKFDALVTGVDRSKKPTFSIKALQISEEKQAVAQYGSSDSGASLGDILGAALKEKQDKTK